MINVIVFFIFFIAVAAIFDSFCSCSYDKKNGEFLTFTLKSILSLSFIIIIPVLLVTFRSEYTGADTSSYLAVLNDRGYGGYYLLHRMNQSVEILYYGISYFFWNSGNARGAFFVYAFISLFFSFAAIYRVSTKYNAFVMSLLFLIIFYHECFNAMRQMNAIALVFFAYTFVLSRNIIMFFICIIAATLFHSTAIIALPLYFLFPSKPLTLWKYAKKILFMFLAMIIAPMLLDRFLSLDFFERYRMSYGESLYQISTIGSIKYFLASHLPLIILMLVFSMGKKIDDYKQKREFDFFWTTVIVFSLILLLRTILTWFFRLAFYYQLGEIFLIGKICEKVYIANEKDRKYRFAFSDFILLYTFVSSFIWNYTHIDHASLTNFALTWD